MWAENGGKAVGHLLQYASRLIVLIWIHLSLEFFSALMAPCTPYSFMQLHSLAIKTVTKYVNSIRTAGVDM